MFKQVVGGDLAGDAARIGVWQQAFGGDEDGDETLARGADLAEDAQALLKVIIILFGYLVRANRIFHFADVDDVVGPVDEQIDLRAMVQIFVPLICYGFRRPIAPGAGCIDSAVYTQSANYLWDVEQADDFEGIAAPGPVFSSGLHLDPEARQYAAPTLHEPEIEQREGIHKLIHHVFFCFSERLIGAYEVAAF